MRAWARGAGFAGVPMFRASAPFAAAQAITEDSFQELKEQVVDTGSVEPITQQLLARMFTAQQAVSLMDLVAEYSPFDRLDVAGAGRGVTRQGPSPRTRIGTQRDESVGWDRGVRFAARVVENSPWRSRTKPLQR